MADIYRHPLSYRSYSYPWQCKNLFKHAHELLNLTSTNSTASNEREDWGKRRDEFKEKINHAKAVQETQQSLSRRLEEAVEAAKKSKDKCFALRKQTDTLATDLKHFETRIHELKRNMTSFSLNLRKAETNAVTAFQYSQTLEEGRTILNEALRLRSELSAGEPIGRLLEF